MKRRRVIVPPAELPPREGGPIEIRGPEHHHLARVLRVRAGDTVSVFDGEGRGFLGAVEEVLKDVTRVSLLVADERAVEPRTPITLLQAIPHQADRMDLVIQKTTEIGVRRIVPIHSARSVVRPGHDGTAGRLARWRRIATEAAKQSGRRVVPRIDPPTPIIEALAEPPGGARRILLATEGPDAPPLSRLLPPGGPPGVMLVVGPEGGWSEADREAALTAGCDAAALGPRVLRSETAGIVAVAVALLLAGDLDGPPPSAPDGGADPAGFDSRRGGP